MKLIFLILFSLLFSNQKIELPKIAANEQIIYHSYYTLSYNETHEQANWVAYKLTSNQVLGTFSRKDNFRVDPKVSTGSALLSDYKGSGYDRGHLAPAADMKMSEVSMSESFYMSNMSPQHPSFNRGIWKKLEEKVRNWAMKESIIYVATGPILEDDLSYIGKNVSIPNYYYKVILDYSEPEIKGIGFILPNAKSNTSLESYAVSIDKVEKSTGIDFFANLPDKIEAEIESSLNISSWNFDSKSSYNSTKSKDGIITQRCSGKTKKGLRCKRNTKSPNGKCWQHGGK
jgi:endonuclease G